MATLIYGFTSLNVADGNSLKEINGALLNDADMALGIYDSKKCFYQLDESSGATESLPDIVSPSLNAGTKRWILKAYLVADITANGLTASKAVFTDANKKLVSIGTLGVDQGGTGASALTDHGVLLGSGTDPITALGAMTDGQLVIGSTGNDPVVASITDGEGIDTTAGAGTLTIACEDASTTNKGVVELATVTETVAGTSTTLTPTCDGVAAAVAVLAREPDQGVAMTYAASGSSGIQVADNDNIDFGTGNFTLVWKGSLPDWTPTDNINLICKFSGAPGYLLRSQVTTGKINLVLNTTDYASSVSPNLTDGTEHLICAVVTPGAVNTTVDFYVDGFACGVQQTAANPGTVSSGNPLYFLGTSGVRIAGTTHHAYTFNRALTAAEVLDLYRNGIAEADKWGSQTSLVDAAASVFTSGTYGWAGAGSNTVANVGNALEITYVDDPIGASETLTNAIDLTKDLVVGKRYRLVIDAKYAGGTGSDVKIHVYGPDVYSAVLTTSLTTYSLEFTCTNATTDNIRFTNANNTTTITVDNFYLYEIGATLALEPANAQPVPGMWLDSSTNNLHAIYPAAGASITRPKDSFVIRWVNTWAGTHEAQYLGGINQAMLPPKCCVTSIVGVIAGSTIEDIILGDGSDTDHWVAITSGLAAGTVNFTIANAFSDLTNYKLVVDPDANFTGSITWTIRGYIYQ